MLPRSVVHTHNLLRALWEACEEQGLYQSKNLWIRLNLDQESPNIEVKGSFKREVKRLMQQYYEDGAITEEVLKAAIDKVDELMTFEGQLEGWKRADNRGNWHFRIPLQGKTLEDNLKFLNMKLGQPPELTGEARPELRYPDGCEPLDSGFYVEVEDWTNCYAALQQPGGLVRIKSPQKMGKTSLLLRLLEKLKGLGYRSALIDFGQVSYDRLANPEVFIQWMCARTGRELRVPVSVSQVWDDIFGANDNATDYFQSHLLGPDDPPLVLGIDNFDRIFESKAITADLCGLLRGWHEQAKVRDRWKKLRLVIAHSQDPYATLPLHQSPFNVGLPVLLDDFKAAQIQTLAQQHGLPWTPEEVQALGHLTGGQPYLVRLALYQGAKHNLSWTEFLAEATTEAGVYGNYLRGQQQILAQQPELAQAIARTVGSVEPVQVRSDLAFKLVSLGLVKRVGNLVQPRCQLYRDYWKQIDPA